MVYLDVCVWHSQMKLGARALTLPMPVMQMDRECFFVLDMHVSAAKPALQRASQKERQPLQASLSSNAQKSGNDLHGSSCSASCLCKGAVPEPCTSRDSPFIGILCSAKDGLNVAVHFKAYREGSRIDPSVTSLRCAQVWWVLSRPVWMRFRTMMCS